MGDFRVELQGAGGHGCQREIGDGGEVVGCGSMSCPDCITARYVADMARAGFPIAHARFVHWPGEKQEVVDEFDTVARAYSTRAKRRRRGRFDNG